MFTRSLIHTTAMTSVVALIPLCLTIPADAGVKIKIKPQTHVSVNVKPKVKVAPKVKLRAAKIRIKTKPKASKQVAEDPTKKVQTNARSNSNQPKVVTEPKKKTTQQFTVTANLAASNAFEPPVPTQRPGYAVEIPADRGLKGFDELGQARAAAEAARMLDELQQLAALGSLRDVASVNSEDNGLDIAQEPELSNRDRLGTPNTGSRGNMFDNYNGPGADEFNGIDNTHSAGPANSGHQSHLDAVNAYYDIGKSIEQGIGGISGQRRATRAIIGGWVDDSHLVPGRRHREDVIHYEDGGKTVIYNAEYPNGTRSRSQTDYDSGGRIIREEYSPSPTSGERGWVRRYGTPRDPEELGNEPPKIEIQPAGSSKGKPKTDVTKLYDPESGHGGSSPFPWINEREKPTADLTVAGNGKTPGAMPQDPHSGQVDHRNTQAAVTTDDVLENWDEDSRHRGTPQPFDDCFHSEC